jgi:hypothetical protein
MPSLIKFEWKKRTKPYVGLQKDVLKLIWFPRRLPAPSLSGRLQLRWLGVERITYEYQRWNTYVIDGCVMTDVGWRPVEWYW